MPVSRLAAADLPSFGFATARSTLDWAPAHDIASLSATPEGLRMVISGSDPYAFGPARNYPANSLLWLRLRLRSEAGGAGQIFFFDSHPTEAQSVRFHVPAGDWHEVKVPLPALGPNYRLRLDPPGAEGVCLVSRLDFEERFMPQLPAWPVPSHPRPGSGSLTMESGPLQLKHGLEHLGQFTLRVNGQEMAVGNKAALIGYQTEAVTRWLPLQTNQGTCRVRFESGVLVADRVMPDPDGAQWTIRQTFTPAQAGAIQVETRVESSQRRQVLYLPFLQLLAGLESFGTNKQQALFSGLEYLENEPSSSEADLRGLEAQRLVPDTTKITFPLMAIQALDQYIGLVWEPQANLCAAFDSPDRVFKSQGHLMGLIFPGSDGFNRQAGSLLPYAPVALLPGEPVILKAWLIGGRGQSVVPAVQHYVALRGLPPLPSPDLSRQAYYETAAHGWLDSGIRQTNHYRHAFWPGFNPAPAADAALWMDWLSNSSIHPELAARLREAARPALLEVPPAQWNQAAVSHVRYPAPALLYGAVAENAAQARQRGQSLLSRFQGDGVVFYQPSPGGTDYGVTHTSKEANGLAGAVVASLLEQAAFCGDPSLIDQSLRHLRGLNKFSHSVPRGAQTWEIPLHTPDILASAHLVKAYVAGYELTADPLLLKEAIYWAWTGLPFVYLSPPTPRPVGLYATIAVLGATGWVAPVWIGLPVQWCGLVYAESLWQLARYDESGPWRQLARGIAASGIQQTWPTSDAARQGLLPDSFVLRAQLRDGPAINPGTVLSQALHFYEDIPVYQMAAFHRAGWRVHASGRISPLAETSDGIRFTVESWRPSSHWLLINGLRKSPRVLIDQQFVPLDAPHQFLVSEGLLILNIPQSARIEIQCSPPPPSQADK